MDPKTLRAAAVADLSTFLVLWGLGVFLGFPMVPSLVVGAVAGGLAFALIATAAKRAEGFSPTDSTDHLRLDRDLTGERTEDGIELDQPDDWAG